MRADDRASLDELLRATDEVEQDPAAAAALLKQRLAEARAASEHLHDDAERTAERVAALERALSVLGTLLPPAKPTTDTSATALLDAHCMSCHNEDKAKGRLVLGSREGALEGGKSGPALVPGKADESLLVKLIQAGSKPHMPPKKQLTDAQIAALRAWINAGATWDVAVAESTPRAPIKLGALPDAYHPVLTVALSADEKRLATGRGGVIAIYDVENEKRPLLAELRGHADAVQSLAWSPDGKLLASGGYGRVNLWDVAAKKTVRELTEVSGRVTAMAFSPDGATLFTADGYPGEPGSMRRWSVADGKMQQTWEGHADTILDLEISRDGELLATAGADKTVKLWKPASGEVSAVLEGHTAGVAAVAIKPDGKLVASASADKTIKVWNVDTHDQTITINGHTRAVTALTWTGDGKHIVSACEDRAARLNDEGKAGPVKGLSGASDVLYAVAASADGKTVYAGCHDGLVYVWDEKGQIAAKLGPAPPPKVAAK